MPCESGPSFDQDQREERKRESDKAKLIKERDLLTCLLCEAMEHLDEIRNDANVTDCPEYYPESSALGAWWKAHQAKDAKRKARDLAIHLKKEKRRQALDKLTPEERKLLGL